MVTVRDIAFVRFAAPDMAQAQAFLADFGFAVAAEADGKIYYRCAGPNHHAYVLEQGEPAFLGFAMEAASSEDLDALSQIEGASAVEDIHEPGGGRRVVLTDPNGFRVEVIHGQAKLPPLPMRAPLPLNYANDKHRTNATQRPALGPAEMKRLGHIGIEVLDVEETLAWYGATLGMIPSDIVKAGPNSIIAFVRCGTPGVFSDHHTLALFGAPAAGFGHAAFEVQDFDAVGIGHYHMKRGEWQHAWGIGRHSLGSQIFDYWLDPWGRMIEHFADGDLFDETVPTAIASIQETPIEWWGPPLPAAKAPKQLAAAENDGIAPA